MYKRLIFAFMLSLISQFSLANTDLNHFYVKIDGSDESNFELEYGTIKYNDEYYPKRIEDKSITNLSALIDLLYESLADESTENSLNILIHGIWADSKFAWEQMIQNISRDTYSFKNDKQKVILSIIWDSSLDYKKGVRIARKKGDYFSAFLKELLEKRDTNQKINFLCHSMGNRVFQHMVNEEDLIDLGIGTINHFVSVGADIESNTFEEGEPLHGLNRIVDKITIYVHNNDRTLGMSRLLNKSDRLGLNGVPDITAMPDNFRTIDVSMITDHDDLSSKIGNHRYFYTSPSIRLDLQRVLFDEDFDTSKKAMKHPRRLKLLPPPKS